MIIFFNQACLSVKEDYGYHKEFQPYMERKGAVATFQVFFPSFLHMNMPRCHAACT
jgi:hypothetical protein